MIRNSLFQKPNLLILGAGPVGLTASHLMSSHYDITLIDQVVPIEKPKEFSSQVVSLIKPSLEMLSKVIDLNEVLMRPYYKVRCLVDDVPFGFPIEASIVDVSSLKYELYTRLPSNVTVVQGKLEQVLNLKDKVDITCNKEVYTAGLALNTLGKYNKYSSTIEKYDYEEMGVVAHLTLENENKIAYQRFLPTGPIAILPTSNNTASMVWTLPKKLAQSVLSMKDEKLKLNIINCALSNPEEYIEYMLNNIEESIAPIPSIHFPTIRSTTSFKSFPLSFHHLRDYHSNSLVSIGDSAHSIHPLAGMGLNLGLGDVASFKRTVDNLSNMDPTALLKAFEKDSHSRNTSMIIGCDFLHDIFTYRNSILSASRNIGLQFFQPSTIWSSFLNSRINKL